MHHWPGIAQAIRHELFTRFLEPQTEQLVTYSEHWLGGHIPTPAEAEEAIPNGPGYSTGIEDGTLRGSSLLAVLCDEYDLTHDPEVMAQAHRLFNGLRRAQDAADPPGFVPRWVLPDGKSCYPNSSGDQHTILFLGLWRYSRSPMATDEQRTAAAAIARRAMTRLRDSGWRVTTRAGTNAHAGGRLLRPRLLALLLAAHRLTGDGQWLRFFEQESGIEAVEADIRRMLGSGPTTPSGWGFYGPQQLSELLTVLVEEGPDAERGRLWRETRTEIARRFLRTPVPTDAHCPAYSDACTRALGSAAHIRSPLEALGVFRHELWGLAEDRDWRADFRSWIAQGHGTEPGPYILWWLGRRPALCHERNCAISPLVAFHIALLSGDAELRQRVREPIRRYFDTVDTCKGRKLGSLAAAHAVAVLAAEAGL